MTPSRQRVADSIDHRQPDRVPADFGATAVTGIHVSVVAALRDHFGLERRPVKVHEPYQMLGCVDDDLKAAMGIDTVGVYRRKTMFGFPNQGWKPWNFNGLDVLVARDFNVTVDDSGDILIHPEGDLSAPPSGRMPKGGYFFDSIIRQNHFNENHLNVEDNLEEFEPLTTVEIDEIAEDVKAAHSTGRYVVCGFGGTAFGDIALVPAPFAKDPKGIRDVTEWYVSTRARRDYVHAIFSRQCEIALANLAAIHQAVGDMPGALFLCGTDFGTQTSTFCSATTFRELWLPYYKQICSWIHANTGWKCFKHSCGSVERFIEPLIEAGFDILNPVQCSAARMEARHLKGTFGDRITFWGGGVDTQKTLPFGRPGEVRAQVLERCEVFAQGGGFVFNAIHNIQAGTPVENVVAMLDAIKEFNGRG
ncbi:MAG TPA: uroporphyrinogen decarboxylase family protein [Bryobacteraceae bacterium]|nr:uroporphyrinogen decarboxylase family protein [Bryobacteraceae bacterium]HPT24852.1 uroporphyrinogen decarboxylase family protein [Bryobacteraceae bacterium]